MSKVTKQHTISNRHMANRITTRCNCGRTVALCAATYVAFVDDDGMKTTEAKATHVLLNCHALEHGNGQTLMVSLSQMAVAA